MQQEARHKLKPNLLTFPEIDRLKKVVTFLKEIENPNSINVLLECVGIVLEEVQARRDFEASLRNYIRFVDESLRSHGKPKEVMMRYKIYKEILDDEDR